jgi:uncharacterized membrane protein YkgB
MDIDSIDQKLIRFFRRIAVPVARAGLFIIYAWFGVLKIVGLSPADMLVQNLFERTIPFIPFSTFLIAFGTFEVLIGILFLIKGAERIVIPFLFIHMVMTFLPLFLLTQDTWSAWFVPTLEGQYIIKNVALIAAAIGIAAELEPLAKKK